MMNGAGSEVHEILAAAVVRIQRNGIVVAEDYHFTTCFLHGGSVETDERTIERYKRDRLAWRVKNGAPAPICFNPLQRSLTSCREVLPSSAVAQAARP